MSPPPPPHHTYWYAWHGDYKPAPHALPICVGEYGPHITTHLHHETSTQWEALRRRRLWCGHDDGRRWTTRGDSARRDGNSADGRIGGASIGGRCRRPCSRHERLRRVSVGASGLPWLVALGRIVGGERDRPVWGQYLSRPCGRWRQLDRSSASAAAVGKVATSVGYFGPWRRGGRHGGCANRNR